MDEIWFDQFYAASAQRITAQIHAMIGDQEEARDCVQEAFARAWSQRHRFADVAHPEAWVRTTAYRLAVSRWRRAVRSRRPADRAVGPAAVVEGPSEDYVHLVAALARLPRAQRQAIVLHHLADLPVAEVAAELDVSPNTVKTRLRRGRAALAIHLGGCRNGGTHEDLIDATSRGR